MATKTKFQAIKGTRDLLPPETELWNRVEQTAREVFGTFGFGEIRLPIFEPTELFARSIGLDTDVVSKEMYSFFDQFTSEDVMWEWFKQLLLRRPAAGESYEMWVEEQRRDFEKRPKGELVTLRPEATASVCRSFIEHGMHALPQPVKLYYIGPMFRRERPQKGRYRQFYQIGAEVLEALQPGQQDSAKNAGKDAAVDAEVIEMVMAFFAKLELEGVQLEINSIGCRECRPRYVEVLAQRIVESEGQTGSGQPAAHRNKSVAGAGFKTGIGTGNYCRLAED